MNAEIYSSEYDKLESIKILRKKKISDYLLFRYDCLGYYNSVSGTKRLLSCFTSIVLYIKIVLSITVFYLWGREDPNIITKIYAIPMNFYYFVFSTIGVMYYFELEKLYQKWRYLADLFNTIIGMEYKSDYCQRKHLYACYGHDLIILGMWSHNSFSSSFKDVLREAIVYEYSDQINDRPGNDVSNALHSIAKNGIEEEKAKSYISKLIKSRTY